MIKYRVTQSIYLSLALALPSFAQTQSLPLTLPQTLPEEDPFYPLLEDNRPLAKRWQNSYGNWFELGLAGQSDPGSQFGQYNGRAEDDPSLIGALQWQRWQTAASWRIQADDLGLKTRSGSAELWLSQAYKFTLTLDSQLQVANNSGQTPFAGVDNLSLPSNWQSANTTDGFTRLASSLQPFSQELERHQYGLAFSAKLSDRWTIDAGLNLQDKQGTTAMGAAFYIDGSAPHAAILPSPIDYRETGFNVSAAYGGDQLLFAAYYNFSQFDNRITSLLWQNPYAADLGAAVDYPAGIGAMALAPDNQLQQIRLTASVVFTPKLRLDLDGNYGVTKQDDKLLPYTANTDLQAAEALPRDSLDGQLDTTTVGAKLHGQPMPRLGLDLGYRLTERDYQVPRDGYLYIRGDSADQPDGRYRVYNTAHDYKKQTWRLAGDYRLPMHSKLSLAYEHETRDRQNAAVSQTTEDRVNLRYRIQPWQPLSLRLELSAADLAADTYEWDQSYYALLDTELINATPDTQRFINHPLLSQYHLANREREESKINISYTPATAWLLSLDLQSRQDNYDKTELGLLESEVTGAQLTVSYYSRDFSLSAYLGGNQLEYTQAGRAFRGGAEKNPFVTLAPLPQASDPTRNWQTRVEDQMLTAGLTADWQISQRWLASAELRYTDTLSEQGFDVYGAADLDDTPLPDNTYKIQQLIVDAQFHINGQLSLKPEYQYFRFQGEDWAIDGNGAGIGTNGIAKVLTLGQSTPDEDIHYLGISAIYRWH